MANIPFRFKPREYQLPLLRALQGGAKRAVICWHRRSGKDKVCLNAMIKAIAEKESNGVIGTYFYFFPTFTQGRRVLWDGMDKDGFRFMDHFPKDFVAKVYEGDMKVVTRMGSVFQVIGTDNIDAIMGTNPLGCVFSEYSLQNPNAWDLIRPILAENGGWAIFNFTPRGMNHAHTILQMAKEQDWFNEVLTVAISEEVLKTEQQQMPQAFFQREYFCQFREGADQFFKNFRRLVVPVTSRQTEGRKFRLGVDLAKYQDFTVIAPLDLSTFTIGELDRFNGFDYVLQEAKIEAAYHRYNKAVVYIDSTGVGDPIVDHLRVRGIRLEPYKFNEQSRNDLLTNLQILLEQGTIQLPNDEQLLSELESFRYELSDRGRLRIAVPENLHDDSVMAVALAVWNLPAKTVPQEDFWTMHQPFKFKDLTEDWWNGV
jgi:hypothetical protein